MELNSKYGTIKIFTDNIEQEALGQIINMANSPLGENAHIRIMPDAHAGAGCTIGTTMQITDKVCPNLVGVDIGCGVNLIKTNGDFEERWEELDRVIRRVVPSGFGVHQGNQVNEEYFSKRLLCWGGIPENARRTALKSLGTLGGGNHFIEAYANGWISVHSGSRNLGLQVAKFYQNLAQETCKEKVDKDLKWLEGWHMENYLEDMYFIQEFFAEYNRDLILSNIQKAMNLEFYTGIQSTHNFIDQDRILRKGAISAKEGQDLVIPLSMRDGLLVCIGKGNEDWNYSAPHGAGRLYSRSAAKRTFTLEQYQESMKGIHSTCINQSTLDEAPFAYKDYKEIMEYIEPTVTIVERLIPIYNFKAGE